MDTMQDIERATQAFAEARITLATHVTELNDLINAAKREKLAAIRRAVARASEKQAALTELITDNRALFERPKTRVLHGVKVGYQKQPGAIEIANEEATIERIKKMFAEDRFTVRLRIKTTEKPIKDAMGMLSGDQLKKLGVKVTDDTDKVIIKPSDSEVDKIVDALLKGSAEEE
jgi:DnaJ-domain-containing protein 1